MGRKKISLNIWRGKKVHIHTDLYSTAEEGSTIEVIGTFIHADDNDIYINTYNEDLTGVTVTINRKNCIMIRGAEETTEPAGDLN